MIHENTPEQECNITQASLTPPTNEFDHTRANSD
jgi:hypothetical protein